MILVQIFIAFFPVQIQKLLFFDPSSSLLTFFFFQVPILGQNPANIRTRTPDLGAATFFFLLVSSIR